MTKRYDGQRVAVVGFGVEGQSSARYFCRAGALVTVYDRTAADEFGSIVADLQKSCVIFNCGSDDFGDLSSFEVIVRSPGIPLTHPSLRSVSGQKITSQTQLFLDQWRDRTIGVTGTKGKGTTCTLLAAMLRQGGLPVVVGGNIGVPMLDLLEQMDEKTWAILELSSFQLIDIQTSPKIGVVLRIEPEHLNWHTSVEEYVSAKGNMVRFQTVTDQAVLFHDAPLSASLAREVHGDLYTISRGPVGQGAVVTESGVQLCVGECRPVVGLDELKLRGRHNLENVAAAAVVASLLGVQDQNIRQAAIDYEPLPHRLELVAKRNGVSYYNDSFSTTPEAAAAAIDSFVEPLAVIVGGSDKGTRFESMVAALKRSSRLKGVVVVGAVADRILETIKAGGGLPVPILSGATTMPEMVKQAESLLHKDGSGGVVLLSPGAASFGLFENYKDRGDQFRQVAKGLT